ncbi:immunoglobulin superfamily member 1-like [Notamacropus eugenii]|uniref:immunoglobulin superfamily member 1-like n=1 Tax=Notamacropus eugenii TaxID=9315 RepID=UPI003B66BE1F
MTTIVVDDDNDDLITVEVEADPEVLPDMDYVLINQKSGFYFLSDTLPRPTLWAIRSPVVLGGTEVTLRCQGQLWSNRFQLWKDGEIREERWLLAAGRVCAQECGSLERCKKLHLPLWAGTIVGLTGPRTSESREPSKTAMNSPTRLGNVTFVSGNRTRVTIWCTISPKAPLEDYSFVLMEAKSLEPLHRQSPEGTCAVFSILSVRAEDAGSYSCIYYRKTGPYRESYASQTLELTVLGRLPRPTLWVHPGLMVDPGENITFWCSRPNLSSLEEVIFTLWKAGTQERLQYKTSPGLWTDFSFPSVRSKHTGSYSCTYMEQKASTRESDPSEGLELVVPRQGPCVLIPSPDLPLTGSLPKPSLSALPGFVVEPGMHVTLQCRQPTQLFHSGVTFTLLKAGTTQPLQRQNPARTSADFPLLSVRAQDAGNYSCVYHERMAPYQVSEPSEVLEIWVTDALPKPSLSAWPGPVVTPGANVTLHCWAPSRVTTFILYKEGEEKNPLSMDTTQDGALFLLNHVNPKLSGNYTCRYKVSTNESLWTPWSDPLEIIVRGSEPSNVLVIILSCVSFLLCLLLLAILCQGSISGGECGKDKVKPISFLWNKEIGKDWDLHFLL